MFAINRRYDTIDETIQLTQRSSEIGSALARPAARGPGSD